MEEKMEGGEKGGRGKRSEGNKKEGEIGGEKKKRDFPEAP